MATAPQRAFSIRIFLPDGTPDGIKIVEKSNWTGRATVSPRSKFSDLRERPEFKKTGVYLLIGQSDPDEFPIAYIGEGDPVGDRLLQHQKHKDFWSSVVFFTSKDENLNKAHVQYLEARLVKTAGEIKRCSLENGNAPTLPSLSEADIAEMDEFLAQMLLIYPALGITIFQKPIAATNSTKILYAKAKGLAATGYEATDGFVVRADSRAPLDCAPTAPENVLKVRKHLLDQQLLVPDGGSLRLARDYTFSSPSLAAGVMLGRSANGRIEWKDQHGRTLKGIQELSAD